MSLKLFHFHSVCKSLVGLRVDGKQKIYSSFLNHGKLCLNSSYDSSLCRRIHLSLPRSRIEDRRKMLSSVPQKDEGTEGELAVGIESIKSREDMIPSEDTPNMLFNGTPFKDVPICNIRVSPNNTILTLSDGKTGAVKITRSCGIEGFKNTRKGTNVAAQATAITFSTMALTKGYKTVKVNVRGLGPGRMSAIKGLQMGGLEIISVTDTTRVSENPPRPRRPKSL